MPSVYNTFSGTQAKINASNNFNIASANAKAGGTATTNFNEVAVAGEPGIFDGNSNDGITDALVASTGIAGLALSYASAATIGAASEQRQLAELGIANDNIAAQSGMYIKTRDTEVYEVGLTRLRNGDLVDVSGIVTNPGSTGISYKINSTTGDLSANTDRTQEYNYRLALSNKHPSLEARTQ